VFSFVFLQWWLFVVLGYLLIGKNDLTLSDTLVVLWYKLFMLTLLQGGFLLQTVSSIRYWYWDYYYTFHPDEKPATLSDTETVISGTVSFEAAL
jgi:hypothetical protein